MAKSAVLDAMQVLNFSIAYGKTAHGLSRDWGTTQQEAQATVDRWYSDRPEVSPLHKDHCNGQRPLPLQAL